MIYIRVLQTPRPSPNSKRFPNCNKCCQQQHYKFLLQLDFIKNRSHWERQKELNSKLGFYNSIKTNFGEEPYLQLTQKPYEKAKNVARTRMSSHKLLIENGRYRQKPRPHRYCRGCVTSNQDTIEALLELPFPELHIETEDHVAVNRMHPFAVNCRKKW